MARVRVRVDTAGASEFSRIDIPYLDGTVARGLHTRLSAHAANTAFKWSGGKGVAARPALGSAELS